MLGFISNVIGGIRIQVNRVDAEAAMALLGQPIAEGVEFADEGDDQPPRCPKCYSVDITCREIDKPKTYTGAWLSAPLPVHEKVCECKSCGYLGTTRTILRRLLKPRRFHKLAPSVRLFAGQCIMRERPPSEG
jgi:hypothetical protein